jgi:hypothetical protein
MIYHSYENKKCYFPPLLSNGEISFAPDAEGVLAYSMEEYRRKGVQVFDGIVVRSGRRLALCDSNDQIAKLFPMGKFTFFECPPTLPTRLRSTLWHCFSRLCAEFTRLISARAILISAWLE